LFPFTDFYRPTVCIPHKMTSSDSCHLLSTLTTPAYKIIQTALGSKWFMATCRCDSC